MIKVGTVTADITGDPKGFNKAIDGVRKSGNRVANKIQQRFTQVGRRMQRVGSQMTAAITAPLVGAGALAVKTAADYETLRQSMNALNGSAEEGARQFNRLKEFSATTPFQLKELASAQNMLQGFGQEADEAFKSMKQIGDIAAITGGSINDIGIAFGQAAAEGRLMTRDIRQLINQGVPAIKLLADTMGVAQSEVLDLASQGEISFEILQKAFEDATTGAGMFANGMERQANTLSGIFSTLKDNVSIALGEIGNTIAETFNIKDNIRGLIDRIQDGITWFNSLSDQTKRAAFTMAGVLGAAGPIIAALGTLSLAIGAISAPIAGVVAAVSAASIAIVKNWDEVSSYFTTGQGKKMWDTLKSTVDTTIEAITRIWDTFGDDLIAGLKATFGVLSNTLSAFFEGFQLMLDVFTGKWITNWDEFLKDTKDHFTNVFGEGGFLRAAAKSFFDWFLGGFFPALIEGANNYWDDLITVFSGGNVDLLEGAKKTADEVIGVYKTAAQTLAGMGLGLDNILNPNEFGPDDLLVGSPEKTNSNGDESGGGNGGGAISNMFAGADNPINKVKKGLNEVRVASKLTAESYTKDLSKMISNSGQWSEKTMAQTAGIKTNWQKFTTQFKEIGGSFKSFLAGELSSAVLSFGEALGKSLSGASNQWKTAFEKIMIVVLDFASSLAKMAAAIGGVMAFIPGFQGQAAGLLAAAGVLQAISSGVKAGIEKRAQNRERRSTSVNDALIRSDGSMIRLNPNDNILAMKDFGNLAPSGGINQSSMKSAFKQALSETVTEVAPSRVFELSQKGRRGF